MTRGKAGHYWRRTFPPAFKPFAVVLTASGTYSIPSGATAVKGWAVGAGGFQAAGGTAYKTFPQPFESTEFYFSIGSGWFAGTDTALTLGDVTITGEGGGKSFRSPGGYSGGDGGANGGLGGYFGIESPYLFNVGGSVGGGSDSDPNSSTEAPPSNWSTSTLRLPAIDVSGLLNAVALAGGKTVEDGGSVPAFGSGAGNRFNSNAGTGEVWSAGYGGGGVYSSGVEQPGGRGWIPGGDGAVVLYFT